MQKGHLLEFSCQGCHEPVSFSVFELDKKDCHVHCTHCSKKYAFNDVTLQQQLKKFAALCHQLNESEEILGNAAVGIDVGEHHVKIPFKLLLTRLNSCLELMIGNKPVSISFRIEPLKDTPALRGNK